MWTHTVNNKLDDNWRPNHFVACYIEKKGSFKVKNFKYNFEILTDKLS